MDLLLRGVVIVLAMFILILFLLSMARTTLLNRRSRDPLLTMVTRIVHAIVKRLAHNRRSDDGVARVTVWYLPLFMLILILTWFSIVLFAFAILYWESGAEQSLGASLISSGSALTTLGFDTPATPQGKIVAIAEGIFGLMIIIFFFSFIPGYQSTMLARDVRSAWLYARVGPEPTAVDVLLWLNQNTTEGARNDFWATWEDWFRQIRVTHVLAPEVIYTPSSFAHESWVICSHVLLDAAALHIATMDERSGAAPHLCLRVGAVAIQDISTTLGFAPEHLPAQAEEPTEVQYAAAVDQLKTAGLSVTHSSAESWERFAAMHATYAAPMRYISEQTLTCSAPGFLSVDAST